MKIQSRNLKIEKAEFAGGLSLHIVFSDGHEQTVDFAPFLRGSVHPEIRKYLNVSKFKRFVIKDGDLMWGDFDLIFPIVDLYENRLFKSDPAVSKPHFSSSGR